MSALNSIPSTNRRGFLGRVGTLALLVAGTASTSAGAAESAGLPGKKVWLDVDQKALDEAYTQSVYAPNMKIVLKRYAANSEVVRARLGVPRRVAYGPTEHEKFDLFSPKASRAPVHVFIHGGAWKSGAASEYDFLAENFVRHGAHCIVPDFVNVLQTGGDITPMVEQVRRCVEWVYKNAASFGGNPEQIYLSGHSSGGHLAGVLVTTDWKKDFGLPDNVIKGAVLVSGIYDLKPVRLSVRSSYVKFTDAQEQAFSPQRHLDKLNTPLVLAHGTLETPEFQRQTEDFAVAAKKLGKSVEVYRGAEYNHFEMIETLANPYGIVGTPALKQMGLLD